MPKNRLLYVWVATGDSWSQQRCKKGLKEAAACLGHDREFLAATKFLSGSVSRQEFLRHDMFSNFKP